MTTVDTPDDGCAGETRLALSGRLTINQVEAVRTQWLAQLTTSTPVALDLSALEAVDAAGLQLLIALGREVHQRGQSLRRVGGGTPALAVAAAAAGLEGETGGSWWSRSGQDHE